MLGVPNHLQTATLAGEFKSLPNGDVGGRTADKRRRWRDNC
jgi:hypothetical protein